MSTSIYRSQYKDQHAISIESDSTLAQFLPTIGAKMCSLVYKPLGLELMIQRPGKEYLLQPYDGSFVAGECSGLDDMFPTIDECFYEAPPWKGTRIPDHGEVWSIPWDHNIEHSRLHMATYGVRFPYRMEKWVSFADPTVLRIDYTVTNLSAFDFEFLWAAHPMFYLEEGAEISLPRGVEKVQAAFTVNGCMARYADEFDWPVCRLPGGIQRDLRQIRPEQTREADKYFIKGKMPEGWCAVRYPQSNLTLALSFPVEQVPYLGILTNEGGWDNLYNLFLEPCTMPFDRPDIGKKLGEVSTVGAKSTVSWYLNISIGEGTSFTGVDTEGKLLLP